MGAITQPSLVRYFMKRLFILSFLLSFVKTFYAADKKVDPLITPIVKWGAIKNRLKNAEKHPAKKKNNSLNDELIEALKNSDSGEVDTLLKRGASHTQTIDDETLLEYATRKHEAAIKTRKKNKQLSIEGRSYY